MVCLVILILRYRIKRRQLFRKSLHLHCNGGSLRNTQLHCTNRYFKVFRTTQYLPIIVLCGWFILTLTLRDSNGSKNGNNVRRNVWSFLHRSGIYCCDSTHGRAFSNRGEELQYRNKFDSLTYRIDLRAICCGFSGKCRVGLTLIFLKVYE